MDPAGGGAVRRGVVIGIVGAESSGKTQLAQALQRRLVARGLVVARVDEHLREFCDRHRRTPRIDEQAAIAAEQARRIEVAAAEHALVVADTTPLMTAVYSEFVFGDTGLYATAEAAHAHCALTLLTALDLPWQADGLQRDGPQVREPVDALLRAALGRIGQPYAIVAGRGEARTESAWRALCRALPALGDPPADPADDAGGAPWRWHCERCGDATCERHALLPRLG